MRSGEPAAAFYGPSPRWWRMALVGLCTLILCSCRGPQPTPPMPGYSSGGPPALPLEAYTGVSAQATGAVASAAVVGPPGMEAGVPLPYSVSGPWAPPGMSQPWPADEYLADGGDFGSSATVASDWQIRGLEVEDTIAHFDTLDGHTVVEPSNRVYIYSPRFGAVRQVVSLSQNEQRTGSVGVQRTDKLARRDGVQLVQSRQQHARAEGQTSRDLPNMYRMRQGDGALSSAVGPDGFKNAFQPFEDLSMIRQGTFEGTEMAWLAEGVNAAAVWCHDEAVLVILDHQTAVAEVSDQRLYSVYTVEKLPTTPKLRITKVASTQAASPGESIDFTLRFDNVGDEAIGNVTVIDNLSTRLEYVPQSAQCSVAAEFSTQPNDGDSLALRWEITAPLKPGEGGVIRFHCKVR